MLQKNRTFTGRSKGVSVGTTHRSISFCNQWFCMCVYFCSQQQRVVKSLIAMVEEICLVCHLQLRLDNLYELGGLFFRNQWNELLDVSIQFTLHCNFLSIYRIMKNKSIIKSNNIVTVAMHKINQHNKQRETGRT